MGAPLQLAREAVDAFRGFAVADPARVALVLVRLGEKAADKLLAVHVGYPTGPANGCLKVVRAAPRLVAAGPPDRPNSTLPRLRGGLSFAASPPTPQRRSR